MDTIRRQHNNNNNNNNNNDKKGDVHGHDADRVVPGEDSGGHLEAEISRWEFDIAEPLEEASGFVAIGSDDGLVVECLMICRCLRWIALVVVVAAVVVIIVLILAAIVVAVMRGW